MEVKHLGGVFIIYGVVCAFVLCVPSSKLPHSEGSPRKINGRKTIALTTMEYASTLWTIKNITKARRTSQSRYGQTHSPRLETEEIARGQNAVLWSFIVAKEHDYRRQVVPFVTQSYN